MKKILATLVTAIISVSLLSASVSIKSVYEEYYDFLVVSGRTERPYLTYRSLQNNKYSNENGFWDDSYFDSTRKISDKVSFEIYAPDIRMSYNTLRPYGSNDGALWQGRGFNASASGGFTFNAAGFSFTFKPEVDFSQNKWYQTMSTSNETDRYKYFWGSLDMPQRFGSNSFFNFDFGDTDVRYSYKAFTVGTGTQARWIGPTHVNSIILSNNAATFPYFDIGFNKAKLWKLGFVELHYSTGILKNSQYANSCPNAKSLFHMLNFAYNPSFIKGLILGINFTSHTVYSLDTIPGFFKYLLFQKNGDEDGKMSVSIDWLFPKVGFECYGEMGVDDFTQPIRNIFHTAVFQFGFKKAFTLSKEKNVHAMLVCEFGDMEMSRDAFSQWSYNFYTHGSGVNASYSNKGQILGAGTGYAGNSQYAGFSVLYPRGISTVFVQRSNPDNNFIYDLIIKNKETGKYFNNYKALFDVGLKTTFFVAPHISLSGAIVYDFILNDRYRWGDFSDSTAYTKDNNFHFELGFKCSV